MQTRGRYHSRLARTQDDVEAAQRLRHLAFHGQDGLDADRFDSECDHLLVEEAGSGALVCCLRMMPLAGGSEIGRSYAAQHYDLAALQGYPERMAEIGRFCIRPGLRDADILRVAWGALTGLVERGGVAMLFGCASFAGTDAAAYLDAFALLRARHLAPLRWQPRIKAAEVFRFGERAEAPDGRRALESMPPLLRSYLAMGGWVSDHAVVDRQMNTLHVFTGLEVAAIPEARKRALRAVAV